MVELNINEIFLSYLGVGSVVKNIWLISFENNQVTNCMVKLCIFNLVSNHSTRDRLHFLGFGLQVVVFSFNCS